MRIPMIAATALMVTLAARTAPAEEPTPRAQEPKAKPPGAVVTCDAIVEAYKKAHSVDTVADQYFVDQSRVAACLKDAGITVPNEDDE